MKVRAKADGHYGGYYRYGPYEDSEGRMVPGEVFEIDATPRAALDGKGKPMQEMMQTGELNRDGIPVLRPVWVLDGSGKNKKDENGNLIPKIRMVTMFSAEWMEPVNDDASVDHPEQSRKFGVLPQMRVKAADPVSIAARPTKLPADIEAVLAQRQKSESPI